MRASPQSFFRYPLSTLLGTESAVRVLRELALHGDELTTTLLSRRTGITLQSVRNVIGLLEKAGLLKRYGQGRSASYQLDAAHPVAQMLIQLFRAENHRLTSLYILMGAALEAVRPRPLAVWMFGSAARGEDRVDSDLDLLLVIRDDAATERAADAFLEALGELEQEQRVSVSVVPVSGEDVLRLARTNDPFWREIVSDAVPLHGPRPELLLSRLKKSKQRPTVRRSRR